MAATATEIRPQATQVSFLSTKADIAIFGGAAFGGKTWSLLVEALRHKDNAEFGAVIFRRTSPQITNEGGLWDESSKIYPMFSARQRTSPNHSWTFPSKATVSFAHLQHEKNVHDWQGSQICYLGFDELPHFTEHQFFYMLSRNRSMCGVRPYVRATCNPDADSWVRKFIAWWIDDDTGLPIPERSGKIRYFVRVNNEIYWADTPDELGEKFPHLKEQFGGYDFCKSVTFIPSSIYDNQIGLKADPGYLASLLALPLVERERLLGGNWNVKLEAGKFFNRAWFEVVQAIPAFDKDSTGRPIDCRFWDFAATEKKLSGDDPDFTAGVLMRWYPKLKLFFVLDVVAMQGNPAAVEKLVKETETLDRSRSQRDGSRLMTRWEIEGGSAGKRESWRMTTQFAGSDAKGVIDNRDKLTRARAFAVQAEHSNVKVFASTWTENFLNHLHGQPDLPHDDIMDAAAGAFNQLVKASGARAGSF